MVLNGTSHLDTWNRGLQHSPATATTARSVLCKSCIVQSRLVFIYFGSRRLRDDIRELFFRHFSRLSMLLQPSTLVNAQSWDLHSHFIFFPICSHTIHKLSVLASSTSAHPKRRDYRKTLNDRIVRMTRWDVDSLAVRISDDHLKDARKTWNAHINNKWISNAN